MLKTSLWETQKAIFNRLSNHIPLTDRVNGVFDEVPKYIEDGQGNKVPVQYPYVVIGEPTVSPFQTKSSYGENIPWVLHCYSNYDGKKECADILNLMLQALTKGKWVIPGFRLFDFNIEPNMQVLSPAEVGMPYQGILRVRFHVNN